MIADGIRATLESLLRDPQVAWSLGRSGALAEFSWDEDEPVVRSALSAATSRGALRIYLPNDNVRLFAAESLGHAATGWSHWLSLCLPAAESTLKGHTSVAEIGPDRAGLDAESHNTLLFDLGIGGAYFQLCVRTDASALISTLRAAIGQPLLATKALVHALMGSSPDRVFESRIARIEVKQPIAPMHGQSPEGPHTHLLPDLLESDSMDARVAPTGWIAQIVAYPPHPLRDVHGRSKPFDIKAHEAFERLLDAYGDPKHLSAKRAVAEAIRSGAAPHPVIADAAQRDSIRIALRQLRHLEGDSRVLANWGHAYGD